MYKGRNTKSKSEIIFYMLVNLFDGKYICYIDLFIKFNISTLTFYRYIQTIRNNLYEFGFYNYQLIYKRKLGYKLYSISYS